MKKILLFIALIIGGSASAQTTNLLISEYGEGAGGNKKYIEIFNGTGADVDLANFQLWKTANGSAWLGTGGTQYTPFSLTGTIINGQTFVFAHNSNDVIGADLYDASSNQWLAFNGNDAIGLAWNGGAGTLFTLIDAVGVENDNPGAAWMVAGIADATKDHVLIRKATVCSPNTNWVTSAGIDAASSEWIVSDFTYNDAAQTTNLGMHTANCTTTGCTPTTSTITASACDTYTFDGIARTVSGVYTKTIVAGNSVGCDSIVTLNLTINNSYTGTSTKSICSGASYTFGTQTLTTAGTYNATFQTVKGCDSIVTLTLVVNPLPTPIITAQNGILTSSSATTYQWINCGTGNSNISGATSMTYAPTSNGSYSVAVVNANGCAATSACFNVSGLGINDKGEVATLAVYPNPTKGKVVVELNSSENGVVSVFNALGQEVYKTSIVSETTIDLSNLQNGVYLIKVTTSKGNNIQRIVKN